MIPITNIKLSQQGIKDIDHTTKRAAIFKAEAKKLGVKVKDIYWTLRIGTNNAEKLVGFLRSKVTA